MKHVHKTIQKRAFAAVALTALLTGVAGCSDEDMDKAKSSAQEAMDAAGESMEKAGESVSEMADSAMNKADESMDAMGEKASGAMKSAGEMAENAAADMQDMASEAGEKAGAMADEMGDKARGMADEMGDEAEDMADDAADAADDAMDEAAEAAKKATSRQCRTGLAPDSVERQTDPAVGSDWPCRWDLLLRYRYIETIALWEGRLTTGHLTRCFGIGRQQASRDINIYARDIAPGNIEYDKYLKGYRPTQDFAPRVTRGTADEYLHLMTRHEQLMGVFEALPLTTANVEQLSPPTRDISAAVLRPLIQAARQGRRLEVDYVSLQHPDREGRIIVPHTLVFTGFRWHVRAWCEKNRAYRDFVLSRFRGEAELLDTSQRNGEDDTVWQRMVEVVVIPDPRLTTAQREVIEVDFGMSGGELRLRTRAILASYLLKLLQLDPATRHANPLAQQIVLANHDDIAPYLFG